jgi:hypothetical protein
MGSRNAAASDRGAAIPVPHRIGLPSPGDEFERRRQATHLVEPIAARGPMDPMELAPQGIHHLGCRRHPLQLIGQ